MKKIEQYFSDRLDIVDVISRPANEDFGEDSFYCGATSHSALIGVFDGCGGLGARKYVSLQGHTGAYLASRTVSGAFCDWYHRHGREDWQDPESLRKSIETYIRAAYDVCAHYAADTSKLRGSLVRKLPTTMAAAFAEKKRDEIRLNILWAGDSRVYLLDEDGLAQLTKDDSEVEDAMENLFLDGSLTNVLSADGNYRIHVRTFGLRKPIVIFAATDGCFSYFSSPMEFEYVLLNTLENADTPSAFRNNLRSELESYAQDDLAMGVMSFGCGSFRHTQELFAGRLAYLKERFGDVLRPERIDDPAIAREWGFYKPSYERYLRQKEQNEYNDQQI